MKRNFRPTLLALLFVAPAFAGSEDKEVKIDAPIKSVTVYLTGAEVLHNKQVSLDPGRNSIVFTGLSSKLIPKSIQFTATGDVSILSITNRIDYLGNIEKISGRGKQLRDSLQMVDDQITQVNYDQEAYTTEKTLLTQNERIGGTEKGTDVAQLKLAADFFRARIKEINGEIFKLDKRERELNELRTRLTQQVNEMNARMTPPAGEITVLVMVGGGAKLLSELDLRYVVSDAGWEPSYDLIAEDVTKPVDLKYRAKVYNSTNVDWKNVKIKLSTANPMMTAQAPQLDKWVLSLDNNYNYYKQKSTAYNSYDQSGDVPLQSQNLESSSGYYQQIQNGSLQNNANGLIFNSPRANDGTFNWNLGTPPADRTPVHTETIQVSELSAEFEIKSPYDIPTDGKPYIVDVTSYSLPATYEHLAVPKNDRDAFLLARITGWEDLDLVEGPANVYFGGTYVGQSYVYTRSVDDTLDLSLGRDKKVVVTRSKLKEMNSTRPSGTTRKETFSYEMIVKNTRKGPITIEVHDQLPISQDAEVTVEQVEISKADYDPATGELKWRYTINAGETARIVLTYNVKYPKNKTVSTKRYRSVKATKF